ncbi:tRNA dihydrouridine(20/20a) synthase DusA [Clostridium celatum]|uniref:tRNA dihydrouridine(20/20a) synthase DusA n=2 Tax=Clostridium celatum TaxID=36834 RepID=UPI0018984583|nr:tRNA dihydrouridine(20/20a) synthase DusA [Clostridium celatum]MDU6297365.1 tRNA dihydrouridine(20/20a) synthase DusA [Clostridium celatum]MDY3359081.1 tRNA dihydrouridine(20/20a) synthase DusA [Clostridium celatum]
MMEKYISNIQTPKISIAPMVDKSHRHFRYFCRLMNKDALLYTEMVTAQAIINGDLDRILYFREEEGPVALQIAASSSEDAYKAVKLAESYNYSEINLNCGCPSDRVSGNLMGAALMADKNLVYEILSAMKEATNKPVTIKHRIGIDGTDVIEGKNNKIIMEGYEDLLEFLDTVSKARPDRYTVHARSAILKGLSPKDNREIPPLDYDMVYRLKKDFEYLNIEINGGFKTLESISDALTKVDGVMIGRASYEDCYLLANLNRINDKNAKIISRGEIIKSYIPYVKEELEKGSNVHSLAAPLQSLFQGQKGSRKFKQLLSSSNVKKETLVEILNETLIVMPQDIL